MVERLRETLPRPGTTRQADELWLACYVLAGLRYPPDAVRSLLPEIRRMKESSTYQAIVAEGIDKGLIQGARAMILRAGTHRFGQPPTAARAVIEAVTDPAVLEGLMDRVFDVDGWPALVADLPRTPPRRQRRDR